MADSTRKRKAHWRGRLAVLALFGLGLLAILVLYIASRSVPPPPAVGYPPADSARR